MRRHRTESLFWKRFPYKLVLHLPFAFLLRNYSNAEIEAICKKERDKVMMSTVIYDAILKYHNEVFDLRKILENYGSEYKFRIENNSLSIFFDDLRLVDDLEKRFKDDIVSLYEPLNEAVMKNLFEERIIIRDNLIHDCRYKIKLKENALKKLTDSAKKSLVRMLDTDRFANTETVVNDIKHRKYIWSQYIYAKESKDLLMFQMVGHELIREVIKIVTYDELEKEKANAD
jgi:hypothetical protein